MDILLAIVAYLLVPLAGTAIVYLPMRGKSDKKRIVFIYATEAVTLRIFSGAIAPKILQAFDTTYNDADMTYIWVSLAAAVVFSCAFVWLWRMFTARLATEEAPRRAVKKHVVRWVFLCLLTVVATLFTSLGAYLAKNGTGLDVLLYTISAGTEGTDPGVILDGAKWILPRLLAQLAVITFIVGMLHVAYYKAPVVLFVRRRRAGRGKRIRLYRAIPAFTVSLLLVLYPLFCAVFLNEEFGILAYLRHRGENTTIYEEVYTDPAGVRVTAPENKKNLIFVWLESMETTYADSANGGVQEVNCIPRLTELAKENTCFAGTDNPLSGCVSIQFMKYTFGALFAASSGTPYAFRIQNNMSVDHEVAANEPLLWDVLHDNGYYNEFVLGSNSNFAGKNQFLTSHGFDRVLDLEEMQSEGYVTDSLVDGWGVEDSVMYAVARDRLTTLAQEDQPFTLMLMTTDTHYPIGHICDDCPTTYSSTSANIVACADERLADFVEWCAQQPFYEDTVIIVVGDHPRMDDNLVSGVAYSDRKLYNCFINCPACESTTGREWTMMDIYPTALASLGFEIEGDRIGFGTNLFSGKQTIPEEIGMDYFENEISKYSEYFLAHFQ